MTMPTLHTRPDIRPKGDRVADVVAGMAVTVDRIRAGSDPRQELGRLVDQARRLARLLPAHMPADNRSVLLDDIADRLWMICAHPAEVARFARTVEASRREGLIDNHDALNLCRGLLAAGEVGAMTGKGGGAEGEPVFAVNVDGLLFSLRPAPSGEPGDGYVAVTGEGGLVLTYVHHDILGTVEELEEAHGTRRAMETNLLGVDRRVKQLEAEVDRLRGLIERMGEQITTRSIEVVDRRGRPHVLVNAGDDYGQVTLTARDAMATDDGPCLTLFAHDDGPENPMAYVVARVRDDIATGVCEVVGHLGTHRPEGVEVTR